VHIIKTNTENVAVTVWTRFFHPVTQWTTFIDCMRDNYHALQSSDLKRWLCKVK